MYMGFRVNGFKSVCVCVCVHSPFEVEVSEEAGQQKVRAWGPGLETGMVGKSADFVVEAVGTEVGTLGKSQRPREAMHLSNTGLLTY